MGFADFGYEYAPPACRDYSPVISEKLSLTLQDQDAHLSLYFMRVNREYLAGFEVEVQDFEIRGVVDEKIPKVEFGKIILHQFDFFHVSSCVRERAEHCSGRLNGLSQMDRAFALASCSFVIAPDQARNMSRLAMGI